MARYSRKWEPVSPVDVKRMRWLGVGFSIMVLLVLFRALTYQVIKREPWSELAPVQYQKRVKLVARRGVIYDRDMNILAMDMPETSLAVDPSVMKEETRMFASQVLGDVLNQDADSFNRLLEENREKSFLLIHRDVSDSVRNRVRAEKINGLIEVNGRKRMRPYHTLAPQVIGITNGDHEGVGGVEQALNDVLRGEDGWAIYQKDALNRNFICPDYPREGSRDGRHVVLTLDHAYQAILEEELNRGVEKYRAKSGTAVLMDPFTGEVLGMASSLGQRYGEQRLQFTHQIRNRAVQVDFEPGSTFKIVTLAAALEEKAFQPNSLIHCENGNYKLGGHVIHDHNNAYAWLTVRQVMEHSSNIGMVKIGKKLGAKTLFKYSQNFGFGTRTGIQQAGEAAGILHPHFEWGEFLTATVTYGQGLSVTPIQLAAMTSAIANGGRLMKPRVVKSIRDAQGNVLKSFDPQVIRRVISEETARQVSVILEGVVTEGSGELAAVEGIRVAGKTGTAQKSVPGYKGYVPGAHVSSFVGFWPADAPMFALVVVLDEPVKNYWGSKSAAPMFSKMAFRISGLPAEPLSVPEKAQGSVFAFASHEMTERMEPEPDPPAAAPESPYHVPSLLGLSVREAVQKLSERNIRTEIEGNGLVISQAPPSGTRIEEGMTCTLICKEIL